MTSRARPAPEATSRARPAPEATSRARPAPEATSRARPRSALAERVAERLAEVRQRIADAGVDPDDVQVVAVTKGFGADAVVAARSAGLDHLGENYAAELIDKAQADQADRAGWDPGPAGPGGHEQGPAGPGGHQQGLPRWHFLGTVQRNKVAGLAPHVAVWEAIDRVAAADAVAARAPGATVLVQVNVGAARGKHGCSPAETGDLVDHGRHAGLDVTGLMAVGLAGDREGTRASFRSLAHLGRSLGLRSLSMGMSDDYDLAVGEGATTIRLGRALFGSRPTSAPTRR